MEAMENVGLITYDEMFCWKDKPHSRWRTYFAIIILHELAHMWFGDMVTMKWWDDLWLNESFATFISHFCLANSEELNKEYNSSWILFGEFKGFAFTADQAPTTHPVMGNIRDTDEAESNFDEIVYTKGSSIVKQIYYYIGDKAFSEGLSNYFHQYEWTNTTFDQFIDKMVEAAGERLKDLKELCKSWLQKAGLTEISLDLDIDTNTNTISKFIVKQKPCLEAFNNYQLHYVDFLFIYDFEDQSKNKVFKCQTIEAKSETIFDYTKEAAPLAILLNYNDWGYMKLVLDRRSIESIKKGIKLFKDPISKQLIYRSLFDQLRDCKISSAEYIEFCLDAIENEEEINSFSALLRNLQEAISYYIPLKYREIFIKEAFELIKKLIIKELNKKDKLNTDVIKALLLDIQNYCCNEDNRKYIKELLNDKPTFNGIEIPSDIISQKNRFDYVKNIFSSRSISLDVKNEYLDKEIKRDKESNESMFAKSMCKALIPDRKNKEECWNIITNNPNKDSLYNIKEMMYGFAPIDQLDLVNDFLRDKYFEVLPILGKKQEYQYVKCFVSYCSPKCYIDDEIINKYESLLDNIKSMPQIYKCAHGDFDLIKRKIKAHSLCVEYIKKNPNFRNIKIDI